MDRAEGTHTVSPVSKLSSLRDGIPFDEGFLGRQSSKGDHEHSLHVPRFLGVGTTPHIDSRSHIINWCDNKKLSMACCQRKKFQQGQAATPFTLQTLRIAGAPSQRLSGSTQPQVGSKRPASCLAPHPTSTLSTPVFSNRLPPQTRNTALCDRDGFPSLSILSLYLWPPLRGNWGREHGPQGEDATPVTVQRGGATKLRSGQWDDFWVTSAQGSARVRPPTGSLERGGAKPAPPCEQRRAQGGGRTPRPQICIPRPAVTRVLQWRDV